MLRLYTLYFNFLMDYILDGSSDEEIENFSENSEVMSDVTDDSDDPDYVPLLVHMEDQPYEDPPSSQDTISSSVQSAVNDEQRELNNEQNTGENCAQNVMPCKPVEEEKPIVSSQRNSDDDGQICSICFEPWTSSNEHRIVSLRCGHLFGRSCITRWLKGQNARCPQCNARARKSEIRNIYAKSVKVIDSSQLDKAMQDLMRETELRRTAEINAAKERCARQLAVQDCERLKKELMEAQKQLQEYRSGAKTITGSQGANSVTMPFHLKQSVLVGQTGGCRIVDSSELLGMLLVSQPSSVPLFPGYGFRKISTVDMRVAEFIHVHQKPIRDMAFHAHDGLVLTASLDKTLRITNILTNSVVQTYNVETDVWSCSWDAENSIYFYGGLKTGEVYMFDIRATNRHVYELPRFGARTPVVSLRYFHNSSSASNIGKSGPLVGKLSDCALHQKTKTEGSFNVVHMPVVGPITCLSSEASGHILVSGRPTPKQPHVTHTICDFVTSESGELSCCPIRQVKGGKSQIQLTRSRLVSHPDTESSLLLCSGDEDANGVLVWDGSSGNCIDRLKTDTPALDLTNFKVNHGFYLTALTDKFVHLFGWNHQR